MSATVGKSSEYKSLGHLQTDDYDEDYFPTFLTEPSNLTVNEHSSAHFECRLEPADDESMRIDWFHNGKPLQTGSRVKTVNDFGIVILEIGKVDARDSGYYKCRVSNLSS